MPRLRLALKRNSLTGNLETPMPAPVRKGYSTLQIALHWAVAGLIVVQFLGHDSMEAAWRALRRGEAVPADAASGANFHAIVGLVILVLALWRLYLRFTRGVPGLPENEPAPLKWLAHGTHYAIYALIVGMPIGGAAAWFLGVAPAAQAHGLAATALFGLVLLHLAGGLFQAVVMRSGVLARMAIPEE
jgi:cytochrome b561